MANALGFRIVRNNSAAWSDRLRRRVETEVAASAQRILNAAQQAAPVATGALRDSGELEAVSDMTYRVVFGRGLPDGRAIYQELGTSIMAAQPYLYPAWVQELPTLMARLAITTQGRIRVPIGIGSADLEITS